MIANETTLKVLNFTQKFHWESTLKIISEDLIHQQTWPLSQKKKQLMRETRFLPTIKT